VLDADRENWDRALDRQLDNQAQAAARLLHGARRDVEAHAGGLAAAAERQAAAWAREVGALAAVVDAADFRPRGWILAVGAGGEPVSSSADVAPGDRLRLHLRDGAAETVVSQVVPHQREDPG
jgi:exonuclease VII large subunit